MFCTNCGRQNDEGMAFCENCGSPLELSAKENTASPRVPNPPQVGSAPQYGNPQPQVQYTPQSGYNPPQAQFGPYGTVPPQAGYAQTPYSPVASPAKKKKTGLVIGLSVGAALIILAVLLIALLPGNSAVVGTWYSDDRGVVLEFKENGLVVSRSTEGRDEGDYTFNAGSNTGVIKADNKTYEYTMRGSTMDIEKIGKFKKADDDFNANDFIDEYKDAAGGD